MNTHKNTHTLASRVLRSHSACEMFSFPKLHHFLAHLHAGLQMITHLPVRPQCQLSAASAAPASCLDTDDGLIECIGSARLVHRECLARWQKRKSPTSRTCEICKEEWLVQLDVLDRECFTRSVRTNPRYPEIYCAVLDDAARARLLELMQPGTLILQSKERAICQRVRLTRRDRAGARERGPSRARSRALAVRIDAYAPARAALAPWCLPHPEPRQR